MVAECVLIRLLVGRTAIYAGGVREREREREMLERKRDRIMHMGCEDSKGRTSVS